MSSLNSGNITKDYNHYLMDYIRDENKIPIESQAEMQSRIRLDYADG